MTQEQKKFMSDHPQFSLIGPPRAVKFSEWGTLYKDGAYERLDNAPRMASIKVGDGAIGIAVIEASV